MKIKLSDNEYYELEIPLEVDLKQLSGIVFKLNQVSKIGEKMNPFNGISQVRAPRGSYGKSSKYSREFKEEFVSVYFKNNLDNEALLALVKKFGIEDPENKLIRYKSVYATDWRKRYASP